MADKKIYLKLEPFVGMNSNVVEIDKVVTHLVINHTEVYANSCFQKSFILL